MLVPKEVTLAHVGSELSGLRGYAERHGWKVDWQPESLVLRLDGAHPAGGPLRLLVGVDSYRALPPAWRFVSPSDDSHGQQHFPQPGTVPGVQTSIFHAGGALICAPFNRLAYSGHGGIHADWGDATQWLRVRNVVLAETLGEMLAVVTLHLKYSPGRLS